MPRSLLHPDELRRLVDEEAAQVVEVLPRPEYAYAHLPDALHLPLQAFDPSPLVGDRPVVVYCNDFL